MTPRARNLTGIVTTVILAGMGLAFMTEGNKAWGIALVGMALFRGYVLVGQMGLLDDDREDEDDEGAEPTAPDHPDPPASPPQT